MTLILSKIDHSYSWFQWQPVRKPIKIFLKIHHKSTPFYNSYRHFTKSFESHERRNLNEVFSDQAFIRGKKRQVLKTPKILETARNYFNCPTIDGVEIENEGGSGSAGAHWERAILHNEQMTVKIFC